jgi:predicted membrane chloride channel (bestrophin family)
LREESTHAYLKYLSDEDGRQVNGMSSVANAILGLQGRDIVVAEREGHIDGFKLAQLNDVLNQFSTSMGRARCAGFCFQQKVHCDRWPGG